MAFGRPVTVSNTERAERRRQWAKLVSALDAHVDADNFMSVLDDAVHDAKSGEASYINNGGLESQVEYLRDSGWTIEQVLKELDLDDAQRDTILASVKAQDEPG